MDPIVYVMLGVSAMMGIVVAVAVTILMKGEKAGKGDTGQGNGNPPPA